ncbi:MAG TPA: maleylpyruvate isomerase N-terminal domain-containing protein [Ktedonobacterales bacterium]|nr:maleylpyruvate isomerase N-terminal domain-containing protein [Ktedonobacterales bacterium]
MAVNPMDYSGKDTVLNVVRTERAKFFDVIDDPKNWQVQTRCEDWEVRDIAGHMIDVTEGYLTRWEMARKGEPADALGLVIMGEKLNENAQKFRSLPREDVITRLKVDSNKMMAIFDSLSADEWSNFLVTHPYMGPLPTFFYPAFHVMDYGVHTWDMHWGLGQKDAKLDERTAGVLVPYMFILMQYTVDQESARGVDTEYGIQVDGEWGGKWRVVVKDGTYTATPADNLDGVAALFHFRNASDFVLTSFQRFAGGEASGDPQVIDQIRHLFFRI